MKIDYDDIQLLANYLEKHCNGNPIDIEVTLENRLEIKSKTVLSEDVTITIYQANENGHLLMPTIMKQESLKNSL